MKNDDCWIEILTATDGAKQAIIYFDEGDGAYYFKKDGRRHAFPSHGAARQAALPYLKQARRYLHPRLITDKDFSIDEYERQMAGTHGEGTVGE